MLNRVSEPKVMGGLLLTRLDYLRGHGGTALVGEVLEKLAPDDAGLLRRSLLPTSWYPVSVQLRLDAAIASVLSPEERSEALIDVGRAHADAILASIRPPDANAAAPRAFLEAVPRLYGTYHTSGRLEYQPLGDNAGLIRTFDEEHLEIDDHCWTVVGCLQRGLELAGAEAVLVTETSCRSTGAPCCEYRCEWHQ